MLKKSLFSPARPWRAETRLFPCFVLASLRGSTYDTEYDSPLRSLQPRRTAILSILRAILGPSPFVWLQCCVQTEFSSRLLSYRVLSLVASSCKAPVVRMEKVRLCL